MALNDASNVQKYVQTNANYEQMALVALATAKKNAPNLKPHLVYNGMPNRFTERVQSTGCQVIFHRLSFQDVIQSQNEKYDEWKKIASGALLRLDLPLIDESDETIIYTDVDVMFLADPCNLNLSCNGFAMAPEFDWTNHDTQNINSGVMIINLKNAKSIFERLKHDYIKNINFMAPTCYDQEAIRLFLPNKWEALHPLLNWKPYWGSHPQAVILHFHGPKPFDIDPFTRRLFDYRDGGILKSLFERDPEAYRKYFNMWLEFFIKNNWGFKTS
jgi:lipopolysaccharide biosynthesis glycosyltransferase